MVFLLSSRRLILAHNCSHEKPLREARGGMMWVKHLSGGTAPQSGIQQVVAADAASAAPHRHHIPSSQTEVHKPSRKEILHVNWHKVVKDLSQANQGATSVEHTPR